MQSFGNIVDIHRTVDHNICFVALFRHSGVVHKTYDHHPGEENSHADSGNRKHNPQENMSHRARVICIFLLFAAFFAFPDGIRSRRRRRFVGCCKGIHHAGAARIVRAVHFREAVTRRDPGRVLGVCVMYAVEFPGGSEIVRVVVYRKPELIKVVFIHIFSSCICFIL